MCRRISKGTFTDLFVGDYFDIEISTKFTEKETVRCVFAGFDLFYEKGDAPLRQHHAIIVPKNCFTKMFPMNLEQTNKGGFKHSYLSTEIIPEYTKSLYSIFNSHLIKYRALLTKEGLPITEDQKREYSFPKVWEWSFIELNLLNSIEINGFQLIPQEFYVSSSEEQFPLFKFNHMYKSAGLGGVTTKRGSYRLRDINSFSNSQIYDGAGYITSICNTVKIGLRPYWLIG